MSLGHRLARLRAARVSDLRSLVHVAGPHQWVFLDCFETLVRRRVAHPDYPLRIAAQRLARALADRQCPRPANDLFAARTAAARALAGTHPSSTTLWAHAGAAAGLNEAQQQLAVSIEYESERAVLTPSPGALEAWKRLQDSGRSLAVVSDMYLPGAWLQAILTALGFPLTSEPVISSCEHGTGKAAGLFALVLSRLGLQSAAVLHCGDDLAADYHAARAAGLAARLFEPPDLHERARRGCRWAAMFQAALARERPPAGFLPRPRRIRGPSNLAVAERIGREIYGPCFGAFAGHVLATARQRQIERIWCIAREGIHLADHLRLAAATTGEPLPEVRILHASRRSVALPGLVTLPEDLLAEARRRCRRHDTPTLGHVLEGFGLGHLASPTQRETLVDLNHGTGLECVLPQIAAEAEHERALLAAYLHDVGFFDPAERLLIDIGWRGSIQRRLERLFPEHLAGTTTGCYFGFTPSQSGIPAERHQHTILPGFLHDERHGPAWFNALTGFFPLIEISLQVPTGSTVGYRRHEGRTLPHLGPAQPLPPVLTALQRGIAQGVQDIAATWAHHGMEPAHLRHDLLHRLARFIETPTADEARALGRIAHDLDWGFSERVQLVGGHLRFLDILHPKRVGAVLRRSLWYHATLRTSGNPLMVPLVDRYLAKR